MNNPNYIVENLFSLGVTQKKYSTTIRMQLLSSQLNTNDIPFISELLKQHLPSVLRTECFNDENLPFALEVKNTEIGHLFEHILLDYLCQLKVAKGSADAVFAGRTKWNWFRDPKGMFHINLNCGFQDADILPLALERTIALMRIILLSKQTSLFPVKKLTSPKNGYKNGLKMKKRSKLLK